MELDKKMIFYYCALTEKMDSELDKIISAKSSLAMLEMIQKMVCRYIKEDIYDVTVFNDAFRFLDDRNNKLPLYESEREKILEHIEYGKQLILAETVKAKRLNYMIKYPNEKHDNLLPEDRRFLNFYLLFFLIEKKNKKNEQK